MVEFTKPEVEAPKTEEDDPRVGQYIGSEEVPGEKPRAVIIGFPSEEGIRIRGGRSGAKDAPDAIRQELYEMTIPGTRKGAFRDMLDATVDLGNLVLSGDLEEDQKRLGHVCSHFIQERVVPIVLGGGQSATFGHFLGYVKAQKKVSILALDARLDVETPVEGKTHSGSVLRQALDHPSDTCQLIEVAGLLPHSCSKPHVDYLLKHNGTAVWRGELTDSRIDELYAPAEYPLMASFDLSAVDQAQAPGVSFPAVNGVPIDLWLYAAKMAGAKSQVMGLDLVELCPAHDIDCRTARLAALTVWTFLRGMSKRRTSHSSWHG